MLTLIILLEQITDKDQLRIDYQAMFRRVLLKVLA
jgi:hypothetical protein